MFPDGEHEVGARASGSAHDLARADCCILDVGFGGDIGKHPRVSGWIEGLVCSDWRSHRELQDERRHERRCTVNGN